MLCARRTPGQLRQAPVSNKEHPLPMYSMLSITPPAVRTSHGINVAGIVISIGVGVASVAGGHLRDCRDHQARCRRHHFFKKPHFKWVAPALRALDHERRVQRAKTIGSLLNSVVSVLVAVITIMYVLQNLDMDIAPLLTSVGILGVAIGFGAQQLIRDFLAGIFITIELGGCSPGSAPLLQGLAISATYDLDRRAQLRDIWPTLLQTVLALPEPPNDRRSAFTYEQAVAALIPAPTPLTFDNDMTATLERARDGWPTAASLAELIPRWIPRATGTEEPSTA